MRNLLARWRAWRDERRNRCRIEEEWCGYNIGRRHCMTHGYRWDPPGERPCPGHSQPTEGLRPGRWV